MFSNTITNSSLFSGRPRHLPNSYDDMNRDSQETTMSQMSGDINFSQNSQDILSQSILAARPGYHQRHETEHHSQQSSGLSTNLSFGRSWFSTPRLPTPAPSPVKTQNQQSLSLPSSLDDLSFRATPNSDSGVDINCDTKVNKELMVLLESLNGTMKQFPNQLQDLISTNQRRDEKEEGGTQGGVEVKEVVKAAIKEIQTTIEDFMNNMTTRFESEKVEILKKQLKQRDDHISTLEQKLALLESSKDRERETTHSAVIALENKLQSLKGDLADKLNKSAKEAEKAQKETTKSVQAGFSGLESKLGVKKQLSDLQKLLKNGDTARNETLNVQISLLENSHKAFKRNVENELCQIGMSLQNTLSSVVTNELKKLASQNAPSWPGARSPLFYHRNLYTSRHISPPDSSNSLYPSTSHNEDIFVRRIVHSAPQPLQITASQSATGAHTVPTSTIQEFQLPQDIHVCDRKVPQQQQQQQGGSRGGGKKKGGVGRKRKKPAGVGKKSEESVVPKRKSPRFTNEPSKAPVENGTTIEDIMKTVIVVQEYSDMSEDEWN